MSLRQRLLLHLAAVLGVSLVIAAGLAYWRAAGKMRTELHAALVVGEQVLIDAVKEIERSPSPYQQMRIILERFSGGRHLRVTLIDKDGVAIASSHISEPEEPAPEWFYRLIGGASETTRVALPKNISGYSALLLEADPRNEAQETWEDLGYGFSVMGLLAVLAATLIYLTIGRELKPLDALNRSFAHLASGDFAMRVAEARSSDLATVCRGFNDMAERLEKTDASKNRLEEQLASVQEEERVELARELHDEIGPLLFSIGIDAASAQKAIADDAKAEALERLTNIRDALKLSQRHVLDILDRLRSGTVEDLGLHAAIENLRTFWASRAPALTISADVPVGGVGVELDHTAYRIVQEGVSNAIRHGKPGRINILVSTGADNVVRLTVVDDGGGFKSLKVGRGLTGMRERIEALGGTLSVRNRQDGNGVIVAADIPLPNGHNRHSDSNSQDVVGSQP